MGVYPTSVTIEAYISGAWLDISADVVSDLEAEIGMIDEAYDNRLADPGTLTFLLDNDNGTYTPSSTFKKGVPIRISMSYDGRTKTKFYGTVGEADIDAGVWGEERTRVTIVDWLDYAVKQPARERPVESNMRMGEAIELLLASVPVQPPRNLIDDGTNTFPTVFDDIDRNSTIFRELNNLIVSEWGYGYMDEGGERFRVEDNRTRANATVAQLPAASDGSVILKEDGDALLLEDGTGGILIESTQDAVFNNAFDAIEDNPKIVHGKHIINEVEFITFPRELDASVQVLFALNEPVFVPALSTITIEGYFSDPRGTGQIGGTDFVDPVASTDYFMYANEDETGTNLTTNLTVTPSYSADRVTFTLANSGVAGYVTHLNLRGIGIYPDNPISVLAKDTASQEQYGVQSIQIRQIYQQTTDVATFEAHNILDIEREPRNVLIRATYTANYSDLNMQAFLHLDIGDLVRIINTKPAIDSYYFIQGMRWRIGLNGIITCTWLCKEQPSYVPIAIEFSGAVASENAIDFGRPELVANLQQTSYTAWLWMKSDAGFTPVMGKYSGTAQNLLALNSRKPFYLRGYNNTDGQWTSTTDQVTLGEWHLVSASYDSTNTLTDGKIYIDGIQVATTEDAAPVGATDNDSEIKFIVGNAAFPTIEWAYNPDYVIKDFRVYNRVLTSGEMLSLAQNENVYDNIQNGLVFHGPFVRNFRYDDYVDDEITNEMFVFDRINEVAGIPHYDTTVAGYQIYGRDPEQTSF